MRETYLPRLLVLSGVDAAVTLRSTENRPGEKVDSAGFVQED